MREQCICDGRRRCARAVHMRCVCSHMRDVLSYCMWAVYMRRETTVRPCRACESTARHHALPSRGVQEGKHEPGGDSSRMAEGCGGQ